MMAFNKLNGDIVGADKSALRGIHDIPLYLLNSIICMHSSDQGDNL